jgi:adenosylcobinamide kinase/adenosylcobinamide-phosphate guanylyltransferase
MKTLLIGGARSGKSAHAEALAAVSGKSVIYIATAQAGDAEMEARIGHHRAQRNADWTTVEEPIGLATAIESHSRADTIVLVDCLTLWLSNLLFSDNRTYPDMGPITPPDAVKVHRENFLQAMQRTQGDLVFVTNEVGQGIVPQSAVARWFEDEAGRLNQAVAARCDRVVLMVAGIPLTVKG